MSNLLSNPFAKYSLLVIYILTQGFFLGLTFVWVLPIPGLRWPYYVIAGYALGAAISVLVAYLIFRKWQAPVIKKIVVSIALLVLIAAASFAVISWESYLIKMHMTETLGS